MHAKEKKCRFLINNKQYKFFTQFWYGDCNQNPKLQPIYYVFWALSFPKNAYARKWNNKICMQRWGNVCYENDRFLIYIINNTKIFAQFWYGHCNQNTNLQPVSHMCWTLIFPTNVYARKWTNKICMQRWNKMFLIKMMDF